jgi:hypothetical protein
MHAYAGAVLSCLVFARGSAENVLAAEDFFSLDSSKGGAFKQGPSDLAAVAAATPPAAAGAGAGAAAKAS